MPMMKGKFATMSPPAGDERRGGGAAGRVTQPRQVLIYPLRPDGLGRAMRASISDLSSNGVGLVCLGRLSVGNKFVMRIGPPSSGAGGGGGGAPQLQVYRVTRCRDGGAASMIGALYDSPFTAMSAASSPAPAGGSSVKSAT